MDMLDGIKRITDADREILRQSFLNHNIELCKNLSFFSKVGNYRTNNNYVFFESFENEPIYYVGIHHGQDVGIFIDSKKKILFYSRYFITDYVIKLIEKIDFLLDIVESINLEDLNIIEDIGNNFVSIQKWHVSYGHFKDELFCISDFLNNENGYKALLDYHTDNQVIKNLPFNDNYSIIANYALGDNYLNAYILGNKILKLSKLKLIRHEYLNPGFHSFPIIIKDRIISKINIKSEIYETIFVSRGKAIHAPRNLSNQLEIENYFSSNKIFCLNPENISFDKFVSYIKNCNKIIITWGSALTNLVYLQPGTKVIILKSKSYEKEPLSLFGKIISTYKLDVIIEKCDQDNIIELTNLSKYI